MTANGGWPAPRVLHGYSGNLYGGIETLLTTMARSQGLVPGVDHEFALCFRGRLSRELEDAGATVHDLGEVRFGRPWTLLRARRRLRRLLRGSGRPGAFVAHACWPHAAFGPVARAEDVPLVFWMHDAVKGQHWLERLAARTPPDLVLANSRYTASTLPALFPGVRAEVLNYPVAPSRLSDQGDSRDADRRALGAGPETTVILQVSRLERWKGQSLLIDALSRLRDRSGWVAWLAGGVQRPHEQAYLDEIQAAAAAGGIGDRVHFLGQRSDVPRLLAAADIHCQPNLGPEPFGITFVEGLYAGLPVVSTRMGGAAEILDETCGVLVPPADPVALASALSTLIDEPATRARLGAAGPARASALCDPATVMARLNLLTVGLDGLRSPEVAEALA